MFSLTEYDALLTAIQSTDDLTVDEKAAAFDHLAEEIGGIRWQSHTQAQVKRLIERAEDLRAEIIAANPGIDPQKGREGLIRKGVITNLNGPTGL